MINDFPNINPHLNFIDADTGERMGFRELYQLDIPEPLAEGKKLVFLYLNNSLSAVRLYLRLLDSPHVLVLLNPDLHLDLKKELEHNYSPNFIYDCSQDKRESDFQEVHVKGYRYYFKVNSDIKRQLHPEIKILLSTSGTTGSAKFVKLSLGNLLSNARSISSYLPIVSEDIVPLNLSIYYSYGLSILHANCLKAGTIVCTTKDVMQRSFWDDFNRLGYTSLSGVPFVYEMLKRLGFTKKEYPSLRYLTQAGGKLANHLIEEFATYCRVHQIRFYVMYGQTEATARMSYLHPDYTLEKLGSIGKPIPNGQFEIDKATGELVYRGPNVFGGYAERALDLADYVQPHELRTGDLARVDDDGFYFITGRAKRFIKLFGTRTNLDEIEELLKNHFTQLQFACTGHDDKLVIAFDTQLCSEEVVKGFIRETLKIHPSVVQILPLVEFPKTSNGKVDYTSILSKL